MIDKRDHVGGNIYTEYVEWINVHKYGAYIFHTSNEDIWTYINKLRDIQKNNGEEKRGIYPVSL